MIRVFDIVLSLLGILFLWPLALVVCIVIYLEKGKPIFLQERMGKNQKPFILYKFRTMNIGTANIASHLSNKNDITKFGMLLRRTKIDELPQLLNVLKGEMSIVGPRPNLFSQTELIAERSKRGVYHHRPGITGLAQINDVDMSTPVKLSELDAMMLQNLTPANYIKYILATLMGKGQGDRIRDFAPNTGGANRGFP